MRGVYWQYVQDQCREKKECSGGGEGKRRGGWAHKTTSYVVISQKTSADYRGQARLRLTCRAVLS